MFVVRCAHSEQSKEWSQEDRDAFWMQEYKSHYEKKNDVMYARFSNPEQKDDR